MAYSEADGVPAEGARGGSPVDGTVGRSEADSGEPLVNNPNHVHDDTIGELGGAPVPGNNREMARGPSNASSSYSAANRSDGSGDAPIPVGSYDAGNPYHEDGHLHAGPYGDGSYGGGQPVIRDVQARRNTRIENPSVVPQQQNAGIAQNF